MDKQGGAEIERNRIVSPGKRQRNTREERRGEERRGEERRRRRKRNVISKRDLEAKNVKWKGRLDE